MRAAGQRIVFDEDGSYIENKKTGAKTEIVKDGGTYAVVVWVKKDEGKQKHSKGKGKHDMGID